MGHVAICVGICVKRGVQKHPHIGFHTHTHTYVHAHKYLDKKIQRPSDFGVRGLLIWITHTATHPATHTATHTATHIVKFRATYAASNHIDTQHPTVTPSHSCARAHTPLVHCSFKNGRPIYVDISVYVRVLQGSFDMYSRACVPQIDRVTDLSFPLYIGIWKRRSPRPRRRVCCCRCI